MKDCRKPMSKEGGLKVKGKVKEASKSEGKE